MTGRQLTHRLAGRLALGAICIVALLGVLMPAAARADGDPASDELIVSNVFYPYSSPVPAAERATLNAAVARAHRDGVKLKVALIARRSDLGSITALYGDPQRYAAFLDTEISYRRKVPLLVVMPSGFGAEGLSARLRGLLSASSRRTGSSGADLAVAATKVVTRIDGVAAVTGSRARSSTTPSNGATLRTVVLLALVLAAVLVAGALVILRVFFPPSRAKPHDPGGNA